MILAVDCPAGRGHQVRPAATRSITLVLRSPDDFIDPVTGEAVAPLPNTTTGVTLKTLVDTYGVLPPEVVETVTPANP